MSNAPTRTRYRVEKWTSLLGDLVGWAVMEDKDVGGGGIVTQKVGLIHKRYRDAVAERCRLAKEAEA